MKWKVNGKTQKESRQLKDVFFKTVEIMRSQPHSIDAFLGGLVDDHSWLVDTHFSEDVSSGCLTISFKYSFY